MVTLCGSFSNIVLSTPGSEQMYTAKITLTHKYGHLSCTSQCLALNGCIECAECERCPLSNVGRKRAVYQSTEHDITLIVHDYGTDCA